MTVGVIASMLALWVLIIAVALLQLGLLRRTAQVLERVEAELRVSRSGGISFGLAPGAKVRPFVAVNDQGRLATSEEILKTPTIVLFLEPGCLPCESLVDQLQQSGWDKAAGIRLLTVLTDNSESREFLKADGVDCWYQSEGVVSAAFGTSITPHAFALGPDGVVVDRSIPASLDDLESFAIELASQAVEPYEEQVGLKGGVL
jgi:thiol-disulfide isomerase/thioredoxin